MSALRGQLLYLDCFSGIAGDMLVAALVDAGVPEEVIHGALAKLPPEALAGCRVSFERVMRGAMSGLKFRVQLDDAPPRLPIRVPIPDAARDHVHDFGAPHRHAHHGHHAHRHYREIHALIDGAELDAEVKRRALSMFERIAHVEARLHGVSVEEVAFHEVGAVDSIVDIVAAAAALAWLAPARVVARRVPLGAGRVSTAHGMLPIPAPATLELLRGAEVEEGGATVELTTPTGAAILADCVERYGALPPMAPLAAGWGAGDRELPDRPNMLRAVIGRPLDEAATPIERLVVVEANLDDLTPELSAPLIDALLGAGARDAWLAPLLMKKGRPGLLVGALCDEAHRAEIERTLFRESSSIGVRAHVVERTALPRHVVDVETRFGTVPVKVAGDPRGEGAEPLNAAPEFEVCRALAKRHDVPTKRVWAEALAAFYRR